MSTARKAHRNGIKKPTSQRYESLKGVCMVLKFPRCTFLHFEVELCGLSGGIINSETFILFHCSDKVCSVCYVDA